MEFPLNTAPVIHIIVLVIFKMTINSKNVPDKFYYKTLFHLIFHSCYISFFNLISCSLFGDYYFNQFII